MSEQRRTALLQLAILLLIAPDPTAPTYASAFNGFACEARPLLARRLGQLLGTLLPSLADLFHFPQLPLTSLLDFPLSLLAVLTDFLGALLPSLMFLSSSLDGLASPAERQPLLSQIGPRHIVILTFALAATFSSSLSIVVEAFVSGIVGLTMMVIAYLSGDTTTYKFLISALDEPGFLNRLEHMITSSHLILIGLGSILVVLAPLVGLFDGDERILENFEAIFEGDRFLMIC